MAGAVSPIDKPVRLRATPRALPPGWIQAIGEISSAGLDTGFLRIAVQLSRLPHFVLLIIGQFDIHTHEPANPFIFTRESAHDDASLLNGHTLLSLTVNS